LLRARRITIYDRRTYICVYDFRLLVKRSPGYLRGCRQKLDITFRFVIPPLVERGVYCNHLVRPSVRFSVRSHFRNRYLSFYWKKWFYIWYMALAWWLVPCLPFPGIPHIYFLFTVQLTNERVGVFLARRSVQHLVLLAIWRSSWLWSHNYVHVCNQWLSPQKYSMQHYVIKSVSGLRQVGGFVRVLRSNWPLQYNWNIVESGTVLTPGHCLWKMIYELQISILYKHNTV
jgi:hypothetical protein